MSKDCPNCGSTMDYRLGMYECPNCGHSEEKSIAGPEASQAKPSGPGFQQQQWGGGSGQVPPPGTLHSPSSAPPPGLEARMSSLGQGGIGGGGGGTSGFGDLNWEKRTYFMISAIIIGVGVLLCLGGCMMAGTELAPAFGVLIFGLLINLGFTWFILFSASSCFKWPCMILAAIQVISSLFSIFSLPATLSDDAMTGGMKIAAVIGWFVGLAFNAWFVSILYRDLQGYDY